MEQYPLIMDGQEAGTVSVRQEGGWTVVEARCAEADGIVRISLYGEGREGYLGVLAPAGEGLSLCRRFSRSELRDYPRRIEYAARAGLPCEMPDEPETAPPEEDAPTSPEPEEEAPVPPEPEEASAPAPQSEEPQPKPQEEQAPSGLEDVYWYASPDGALVCFDGESNLIALPAGDPRIPSGPGGWPRTIEGRDYNIYRTKDGKLVR